MRKLIIKILVLLVGLLCFNSIIMTQTLTDPTADNSLKPIKLQLKYKHQFQFAGYYAALYKGFYKDAGFDVEILEGIRQNDALNNVLSNEADYGISDMDIIEARMLGEPVVVLATIFQHSHHILLTKKSNNIRRPSDLIGKKIMIQRNDITMIQLISIFLREGLDTNTIEFVNHPWSLNALIKDSVAMLSAYITDHPYQLEEKHGIEYYILKADQYGIDFYGDMLFTSESNVNKNSEDVIKFKQATLDGWKYALSNEDEVIDYILNETDAPKRTITRERLKYESEKIKELTIYSYADLGHINHGRIETMARAIAEVKKDKKYSLNNLVEGFIFDPNPPISKTSKILLVILTILFIIAVLSLFTVYSFREKVKQRTTDLEYEIKQRKMYEETLIHSEKRYKSLFEDSPLSILEINYSELIEFLNELKSKIHIDLKDFLIENPNILESCYKKIIISDVNKQGCLFLQIDKENYSDLTFLKFNSKSKFLDHILSVFYQKYQSVEEYTITLHNNEQKEIIICFSNYNDYKKVVISLVDITERKKMESVLLEREKSFKTLSQEFQSILNSVPDAIIVLDHDRKIKWMNNVAASKEYLGQKEQSEKTLKDSLFCCKTFLNEKFICDVCTVKESAFIKEQKNKEFTIKNGNKILELRTIPLTDENDNLSSVIIMIRDNTMKKRVEEEIFKKEKIESVGVLAGGIAHDFNNLLTAILGNISLSKLLYIKKIYDNDKIVRSLESAEKAAIRAKDLSSQLLTFSKGGAPIKKQTNLQNIIKDSAKFVMLGSKNKLEIIIPDDIWMVEIDSGQISQVIQNLVMNADQATIDTGNITINCQNVIINEHNNIDLNIKNGNYVKVSIKDQGIGIPEELKAKIFDPYFTTKAIGSGLGLTTCYNIIKKHQGVLKFNSVVNKGSEFYFYLPTKAINDVVQNETNITTITSSNKQIIIGNEKILVVDDEQMVRDLIFDILTGLGYRVECFPEGSSAVKKYKEVLDSEPFDLVITDLTIPGGMGGAEVLSSILKINPEAKIIVSSGYSNDPMMAEYTKYGFTGVIPKPYDVESLNKVIQSAIQN